jgi:hypothetical protein
LLGPSQYSERGPSALKNVLRRFILGALIRYLSEPTKRGSGKHTVFVRTKCLAGPPPSHAGRAVGQLRLCLNPLQPGRLSSRMEKVLEGGAPKCVESKQRVSKERRTLK